MTVQHRGDAASLAGIHAARHSPVLFSLARCGIFAGIALLWGCASYSPMPVDPFLELKELEQRNVRLPEEAATSPGKHQWFPLKARVDLADGLDLAEANTLALFYAPEVRAARNGQEVSAAQLLGAGLLSNPELFLGPRISSGTSDLIFPAGISWELPLWGRNKAEKKLAGRKLSQAESQTAAAELMVLTEVRSAFIRLDSLVKTSEALEARLGGSKRVLQWSGALKQAGEIDGISSYLAKLEHDDAQAALKSIQFKLGSEKRRLQQALGLLPNPDMVIRFDPSPGAMPELPQLNGRKMLLHPGVIAAQREYEAAEAALELEFTGQYPAIRLGPDFESDQGEASAGVGAGVELPLFNDNRGGVAAAVARRKAVRGKLATALLRQSHAEAQARAEAESTEAILRDYRAGALLDAELTRRSLDLRLQAGQSNVLEVLTGLSSLARAHIREIELEKESAIARFSAAVAGGSVLNDPVANDSEKEKK